MFWMLIIEVCAVFVLWNWFVFHLEKSIDGRIDNLFVIDPRGIIVSRTRETDLASTFSSGMSSSSFSKLHGFGLPPKNTEV